MLHMPIRIQLWPCATKIYIQSFPNIYLGSHEIHIPYLGQIYIRDIQIRIPYLDSPPIFKYGSRSSR